MRAQRVRDQVGRVRPAAERRRREVRRVRLDEDQVPRRDRERLAQRLRVLERHGAGEGEVPAVLGAASRASSASPEKQWKTVRSGAPTRRQRLDDLARARRGRGSAARGRVASRCRCAPRTSGAARRGRSSPVRKKSRPVSPTARTRGLRRELGDHGERVVELARARRARGASFGWIATAASIARLGGGHARPTSGWTRRRCRPARRRGRRRWRRGRAARGSRAARARPRSRGACGCRRRRPRAPRAAAGTSGRGREAFALARTCWLSVMRSGAAGRPTGPTAAGVPAVRRLGTSMRGKSGSSGRPSSRRAAGPSRRLRGAAGR